MFEARLTATPTIPLASAMAAIDLWLDQSAAASARKINPTST